MFRFLGLGRRKAGEPLSSVQAMTAWMNELPLNDVFGAHTKVVGQLKEFNSDTAPFDSERFTVLLTLDAESRVMHRTLCRQYLMNPRMSKSMESQLWNAIYAYHWEMTRAYHAAVMEFISDPGASKIKPFIATATCKALYFFSEGFKWRYFRFERIDEKLWLRLHNLYRFAEFQRFEREPIDLYPGEGLGKTSCADEYIQALMLGTLQGGHLYPRQIDLVDEWLNDWSPRIQLEQEYDAGRHVYVVDMGKGEGAKRVRNRKDDPFRRYWGTSELLEHIAQVRERLREGEAPALLGLGESCKAPTCLDFLEEISQQWAPDIPRVRRRHPREKAVKQIEVVHGVHGAFHAATENIGRRLRADSDKSTISYMEEIDVHLYGFVTERTKQRLTQKEPEPEKETVHERWIVENASLRGYGATLNKLRNEWVRLNSLVGVRPDRESDWQIAAVRRLVREGSDLLYVGLEVISPTAAPVLLKRVTSQPVGYVVDEGIDSVGAVMPTSALFLPRDEETDMPQTLLLEAAAYAHERQFQLSADENRYTIRLGKVIQRGEDWVRAVFDRLESE